MTTLKNALKQMLNPTYETEKLYWIVDSGENGDVQVRTCFFDMEKDKYIKNITTAEKYLFKGSKVYKTQIKYEVAKCIPHTKQGTYDVYDGNEVFDKLNMDKENRPKHLDADQIFKLALNLQVSKNLRKTEGKVDEKTF